MKTTFFFAFSLVLMMTTAGNAFAQDLFISRLLTITSNRNADRGVLSAIVTAVGEIRGIHLESQPASPRGEAFKKSFSLMQIESPSGAVLLKENTIMGSVDVIVLRADINETIGEGTLKLRFMTNALRGAYNECMAQARRINGQWMVVKSMTGLPVTELNVETHKTGVKTVHGICD